MITIIILIVLAIIAGGTLLFFVQKKIEVSGVDDWKYKPQKSYSGTSIKSSSPSGVLTSIDSATASSSIGTSSYSASDVMSGTSESYLGYTVGGASNVDSFRENIKKWYIFSYKMYHSLYYSSTISPSSVTSTISPSIQR